MKNWLCILALLASPALAQPGHGPISGGGAGQSSGGAATAVTGSASLPATCAEKDLYQDTDSGGTEFYVCTATNTWTKTIAATDNAATATALAANGANCTAGNYPLGVDASGAVESCTAVPGGSDPTLAGDVDGLGSANDLDEVAVEAELEAVLDLPDLQGAVTDAQVPNAITVDLATLATTATTANAGDSATSFFTTGTIEAARLPADDDVPEAGDFGALALTGDVTSIGLATTVAANAVALGTDTTGGYAASTTEDGPATTATALAANGGNCTAGNYPLGVDTAGAVETCTADDDVPEVGDYTNLVAGRSLTAPSAGTVDADAELYTKTKCMTIETPAVADDFLFFRAETAITITGIDCLSADGTSVAVLVKECNGNGGACGNTEASITCGTTNTTEASGIDDSAVDAGDWMRIDPGTNTGTVTQLSVCVTYTVND